MNFKTYLYLSNFNYIKFVVIILNNGLILSCNRISIIFQKNSFKYIKLYHFINLINNNHKIINNLKSRPANIKFDENYYIKH